MGQDQCGQDDPQVVPLPGGGTEHGVSRIVMPPGGPAGGLPDLADGARAEADDPTGEQGLEGGEDAGVEAIAEGLYQGGEQRNKLIHGGVRRTSQGVAGLGILSRSTFPDSSPIPKFKDEPTMPFTKGQPEDRSELRDLAYGWGKIVTRRALRRSGAGARPRFRLHRIAGRRHGPSPHPWDHRRDPPHPVPTPRRPPALSRVRAGLSGSKSPTDHSAVRGGTVTYDEPVCHCPACRRDFFPSPPEFAARLAQLLSGDPR